MAYPVVRLDKIGGKAHVESITFATGLANGTIVALGALATDGESFVATAPTDVSANELVLHCSVPMTYVNYEGRDAFVLGAGKVGRAYKLTEGDIITITDDGIDGATTKGQYVIPQVGDTQMLASATVGLGKIALKVIEKENLGDTAASVLKVVKA